MTLTVTLRDAERIAGHQHQLRLLRNQIADEAPALPETDGIMEDALQALHEAESALEGVRDAILWELRKRDDIEAGDRDPDGDPRPWPRYP